MVNHVLLAFFYVTNVSFSTIHKNKSVAKISEFTVHIHHMYVPYISAFTGYETNNKYEVLNSLGQRCFYAVEGKL